MSPGGPDAQDPAPGLPPRYEVRNFLGKGAMGRVFLCRDTELDVVVAVKVLAPHLAADPSAIEQVKAEARAVAKFRGCPSILSLYGFEQFEGSWYLVMEYAAGGSLDEKLKREGRFPEKECRRIGAEVAEALAFAHRHRVLHRDIKPANILLDAAGRVKVADFGIAKVLQGEQESTSTLSMAGTPVYMPPEAILRGPLDARSDIYSLGCMLYEMAAGKRPYAGTPVEIFMLKAGEESRLPDVRALVPEISTDYSAIVHRAAAPSPGERFPDGSSLAAALRAGAVAEVPANSPTMTRPPSVDDGATIKNIPEPPRPAAAPTPLPPPPPPKKSKAPLVAAAVVVLLAAGGAWAIFGGGGKKEAPVAPKPPASEEVKPAVTKEAPKTEAPKSENPKPETPKPVDPKPEPPKPKEEPPPPPKPPAFVFAVKDLPKPRKSFPAGWKIPAGFAVKEEGRIACLKDGSEMAFVEPGTFEMGSSKGAADEKPAHRVSLHAYLIDRHEVTVAQYRTFCKETKTPFDAEQFGPEDGPVVNIGWEGAAAYAAWAEKRLPTEAEWERAARGPDGLQFPYGDTLERYSSNSNADGRDTPDVVTAGSNSKDRSPADCFDMGGNAQEWCSDWYGDTWYQSGAEFVNPTGPLKGESHVIRGGAANLDEKGALTWRRYVLPPTIRPDLRIGFRCAADVPDK